MVSCSRRPSASPRILPITALPVLQVASSSSILVASPDPRDIAYCTMFGSSYSAHIDLFSSSVLSPAISSSVSEKSKMPRFSAMRSLCVLFGMTTIPRCTSWRSATCAGDFPWASAILLTTGLDTTSFSLCWASGPQASCWTWYLSIQSWRAYCCQNMCVSTWFTAGTTLLNVAMSAMRSALKFEMPMARILPSS